MSLPYIQMTMPTHKIRLLDFGWSVSADSMLKLPDDKPVNPFLYLGKHANVLYLTRKISLVRVEQYILGRGHLVHQRFCGGNARTCCLADVYSFGMILIAWIGVSLPM